MIKLSKFYVLILAVLILPVLASSAMAWFGPTVFNTFSHDFTALGTATTADAAANAFTAPSWGSSWGGVPFFCSPFFGPSSFSSSPFSADSAADQWFGTQALEDNTFATSFATGC